MINMWYIILVALVIMAIRIAVVAISMTLDLEGGIFKFVSFLWNVGYAFLAVLVLYPWLVNILLDYANIDFTTTTEMFVALFVFRWSFANMGANVVKHEMTKHKERNISSDLDMDNIMKNLFR
jgi:hypothetical protein